MEPLRIQQKSKIMKSWSAGNAIKSRRKALGLSLETIGTQLGVTKSFMSYVESDDRALTEEQAAQLSSILGIPIDLLLLSAGRLPCDVRDAIAINAAEVTASVRQRYEQHAVIYPDHPLQPLPGVTTHKGAKHTPVGIPERVEVSKTTASYRAHSYHTKVPPEAIRPFIRALSMPGDLILDPFSGSGMTGVAALSEGRCAILSDLSPAAVHISRNYTTPCDPKEFERVLQLVADQVEPTMRWLYHPIMQPGQTVEYTTWSDTFQCSECQKSILYWDVVQADGTDAQGLTCPHCDSYVRKSDLLWVSETPVQTHVSAGSNRISVHAPTQDELELIWVGQRDVACIAYSNGYYRRQPFLYSAKPPCPSGSEACNCVYLGRAFERGADVCLYRLCEPGFPPISMECQAAYQCNDRHVIYFLVTL